MDFRDAGTRYDEFDPNVTFHLRKVAEYYVMLTVHLSITLDNDQFDTHLLYFTIRLL